MKRLSEDLLSDSLLKWILHSFDPLATIESVRRLPGSTSSLVHNISISENHVVQEVVLRQFNHSAWLREEPDLARHEAENLRFASQTILPTPQVIAFDETGFDCGMPVVLMTKLPGSVDLKPQHMDQWVSGLAEALVQVHSLAADGQYPWTYFTYTDIASLKTPTWSRYPDLWNAAIAIVKGPQPHARVRFIHRDYHPANVLWTGHRVTGIVDWVNACNGPAGIDIGHCRANLAQLFGVSEADAFLLAYQHHAGQAFSYHPYWDLLSLMDMLTDPPSVYSGWSAFGVTGLTEHLMMARLDAYMVSLMVRVSCT